MGLFIVKPAPSPSSGEEDVLDGGKKLASVIPGGTAGLPEGGAGGSTGLGAVGLGGASSGMVWTRSPVMIT